MRSHDRRGGPALPPALSAFLKYEPTHSAASAALSLGQHPKGVWESKRILWIILELLRCIHVHVAQTFSGAGRLTFTSQTQEIMKADCFSETFYSLFQVLANENCFSLEIMLRIKGLPVF